jgi:glutathione reductase (NADPH)
MPEGPRFDVDLFVIGGGSGGVRAAKVAAKHGARVAIAEDSRWGGTCVIRGCVPKKLLMYGSEVSRMLADARGYGWTIEAPRFDWPTLAAAVEREVTRLSGLYAGALRSAGAALHDARAVVVDPHTVEVDGRRVTAAHILVATGGRPRPLDAGAPDRWIVSDQVFRLPALPRRLVIVGSGYVGVEFAHIFAGLGVDVTMVLRRELPLRGFDPDVRAAARDGLLAHGVTLDHSVEPLTSTALDGGGLRLRLSDGSELDADLALAAVGRDPATAGLGLVEAGVALTPAGAIVVDDYQRTSVPSIHAVGDVTGNIGLTPVAIREGHAVADTLFGGRPTTLRRELIPTAVFGQPPVAAVGLTEPEAANAGFDVQCVKTTFKPMRYTLSGRDESMLIKLVLDRRTRRVLGVHMVGPDAPEIIQAAAIAVTVGATKDDFDRTIALHPTTAEELVLLRE